MTTQKYIAVLGPRKLFMELKYLISLESSSIVHIRTPWDANGIHISDIIYLDGWLKEYKDPILLKEYLIGRIR